MKANDPANRFIFDRQSTTHYFSPNCTPRLKGTLTRHAQKPPKCERVLRHQQATKSNIFSEFAVREVPEPLQPELHSREKNELYRLE